MKFSRRPTRTLKPFRQLTQVLLFMVLLTHVWKNVVKNSGTTVKNKTKKIARSSISYTINLFFAVFWGCHCIWASASVRGHPREKHLVYVVGAGSRATHCKKRGSKRAASRRENGQKSFKMPRDRLFWCRFEPIEPPQRRTSFTMWPPTI